MNEYANAARKRARAQSIEDVPEFRQHLARNGLRNLAEWEVRERQRQRPISAADADADADLAVLAIKAKYLRVMARRR